MLEEPTIVPDELPPSPQAGDGFLRRAGALVSANIYNYLIAALSGPLIARWVAPSEYGIWVALHLVPAYVFWFHLGSIEGLSRDLPIALGRDRKSDARRLTGTVFVFNLIVGLLSVGGVLVIGRFLITEDHPAWTLGLVVMCFYSLATHVRLALETAARSYGRFKTLSFLIALQATVSLFGLVFVRAYDLVGLYARMVVVLVVVLITYGIAFRKHVSWNFDVGTLRGLIRTGLPIHVAYYAALVSSIADRTLGSIFLSREQLGIFGLAVFVYSTFALIGSTMTEVVLPEMAAAYGKEGASVDLWPYVKRHLRVLALVVVGPLVIAWLALPWLLRVVAPAYVEAAGPARILLIGSLIWSATGILGNVLITLGKAWRYAASLAVSTAILWGVGYLALRAGYGPEGIAFANVIAVSVLCIWCGLVVRSYHPRRA